MATQPIDRNAGSAYAPWMASTATLVGRFATLFNSRYGTTHSVSSPLGLWLLLALLAPAAQGDPRAELEQVLGVHAEEGFARASELLEDPHPAVGVAVAMMTRGGLFSTPLADWLDKLPASVECGDIPAQEEADAWASRHTFGLIPKFPVAITQETLFLLASVLACDVSWMMPYEACPGSQLGGVFGPTVSWALDGGTEDRQFIAETEAAGLVAVHVASSPDGVDVVSVIAEPSVEPDLAHRATREITEFLYWGDDSARALSLFELPLVGHAWEIVESRGSWLGWMSGSEGLKPSGPCYRHGVLRALTTWQKPQG